MLGCIRKGSMLEAALACRAIGTLVCNFDTPAAQDSQSAFSLPALLVLCFSNLAFNGPSTLLLKFLEAHVSPTKLALFSAPLDHTHDAA